MQALCLIIGLILSEKMVESSKEKTRKAQTRKIAVKLLKVRTQLVALSHKFVKAGFFNEVHRLQAEDLIIKINNYKLQIIEMGFNPKEAAKWAAEQIKTNVKLKIVGQTSTRAWYWRVQFGQIDKILH